MKLPSLIGWRAVVIHRPDEAIERLTRQLGLLGLTATVQWAPLARDRQPADIVLFDADQAHPDFLPWPAGHPPLPVVALLHSEAPGRVAFALERGAGAFITKPVMPAAVYPALALAAAAHAERGRSNDRIVSLEERLRMRPLVHGAVRAIMDARDVCEETAFRRLRMAAMNRRITMEQISAEMLAGITPLPEVG